MAPSSGVLFSRFPHSYTIHSLIISMLLSCSGMFYPKLGQCTPSATGTAEPAPVKCIAWDDIKCRGGGIGGRKIGLSIPSSLSHSLWWRSEWGAERQAVLLQWRPLHMDNWSKERGSPRRLQCLCCKDLPPRVHTPCPNIQNPVIQER